MEENKEVKIAEAKNGCLALLVAIACVPLSGWVITKLWEWYVVPFEIPQITIAHAVGLDLLISYLTMHYTNTQRTLTERVMISIGTPLVFLLLGCIVNQFM